LVEQLSKETNTKLDKTFNLNYKNLYFALKQRMVELDDDDTADIVGKEVLVKHYVDNKFDRKRVKTICRELVTAIKVDYIKFSKDALIYFALLCWPWKEKDYVMDPDDEDLFRFCIDRLGYVYKQVFRQPTWDEPPFVYFDVAKALRGRTDSLGHVSLILNGNKDPIQIPLEVGRKHQLSVGNFVDVELDIDMTDYGPIARNVRARTPIQ